MAALISRSRRPAAGVRSLTAMSMLTAIDGASHAGSSLEEVTIFAASLLFAILGDVGRLFTIILIAKFISQEFAGGLYHDYSGFLFFPIGVLAITGFSRIVNLNWKHLFSNMMKPEVAPAFDYSAPGNPTAKKSADPISYDDEPARHPPRGVAPRVAATFSCFRRKAFLTSQSGSISLPQMIGGIWDASWWRSPIAKRSSSGARRSFRGAATRMAAATRSRRPWSSAVQMNTNRRPEWYFSCAGLDHR